MMILAAATLTVGAANAEDRVLKFYNTHTKERAVIVYKRDGKYDQAGLAKVNHMLRDWRQNEPTKMDPHLLDLVWTAYQKSGSKDYINIISGYRSPATNGKLRKRSKGVAKNSQHMKGKALDFFLPDVPLADLRAVGLQLEVGGVGFYPTSGSPFVHMDTGSVRHWPRMSRRQLVKVFPEGKTIHVPSDGKPLPGYAKALAAHKLRGKYASLEGSSSESGTTRSRRSVGEPVVIASVSDDSDEDEIEETTSTQVEKIDPPLPRRSPIPAAPPRDRMAEVIVANADAAPPSPAPGAEQSTETASAVAPADGSDPAQPKPFESASNWRPPPVPTALARAMAERDVSRSASLPIPPTAVVSTVDVSRPLRADAITTAVLQDDKKGKGTVREVSPVFAYAAAMDVNPPTEAFRKPAVSQSGIPIPVANPLLTDTSVQPGATGSVTASAAHRHPADELTLTALDTLGLRLWIGSQSTRQKQYALLTMPDFSQIPSLLEKPQVAYSVGFGGTPYQGLRTDRFSGPLAQLPMMIDLSARNRWAFR